MTLMNSQEDYYRLMQAELGRSLRVRWQPDEDLSRFEELLQRLDETSGQDEPSDPHA